MTGDGRSAGITSYFKPISKAAETVVNLCDESDDDHGRAAMSIADEPIIIDDSVPMAVNTKCHPFFQRYQRTAANKDLTSKVRMKTALAPGFPSFLGTWGALSSAADQTDCLPTARYHRKVRVNRETHGSLESFRHVPYFSPLEVWEEDRWPDPSNTIDGATPEEIVESILRHISTTDKDDGELNDYPGDDDDDDWLPSSFRHLKRRQDEQQVERGKVFLLLGPCELGKGRVAQRLADSLAIPLLTVKERTSKALDDLLIKGSHSSSFHKLGKRFVILLDAVDVVFEGERPFLAALGNFLTRMPADQVVILTASTSLPHLEDYYEFPVDLRTFHVLAEAGGQQRETWQFEASRLELASALDRSTVTNLWYDDCSLLHLPTWIHSQSHLYPCHESPPPPPQTKAAALRKITSHYHRVYLRKFWPCKSLTDWALDVMPVWSRLEGAQEEAVVAGREEMSVGRKRPRRSRSTAHYGRQIDTAYLASISKQIIKLVIEW